MPTIEEHPKEEQYREIPASILDDAPDYSSIRASRASRYAFGILILAAFGAMGYLAISNNLFADDTSGDIDVEQLVAEHESAAMAGVGASGGNDSSDQANGALGDVRIDIFTDPEGADVEIDAQRVGTTPLTHQLRPGAYILSINKPNYGGIDTVLVFVEGGQQTFSFRLQEAGGNPEPVGSEQSYAADLGDEVDPTRAQPAIQDVDRASRMRGAARNSEDAGREGARYNHDSAEIVISSHPSGASVLLDGRFIGYTPLSAQSVDAGRHALRIFMDDYEPYERSIQVRGGESASVHGVLAARKGDLSVLVRPWGSIYIDGVLQEAHTDVRYTTSVTMGEHTVVAVHPTLGSVSKKVEIRAGGATSVVIDLEKDN